MDDTPLTLAIKLLSRREHSAYELRQKLMQRKVSTEDCDAVLARVAESDLQSDRRFAEAYVRQKQDALGDMRLRAELFKRGVDKACINAVFAEAPPPQEAERAIAVVQKKYPRGITAAQWAAAQRFLHARGFSGASIRTAVGRMPDEAADDSE